MNLDNKRGQDRMTDLNILVTGVGSTTAQSVIKGLRKQEKYNISLIGADINHQSEISGSFFCDNFHMVPPANKKHKYINSLLEIVDRSNIDLLIPIVDTELDVLSGHKSEFRSDTKLLLSDQSTISNCNNKYEFYKLLEQKSISTPKTLLNPTKNEVIDEFTDFPLIAKPVRGVSSRGIQQIRNKQELCLLNRIDEPIVQPLCEGQEYTIDVFRRDGETIAVPRQRLETRSGLSYKGRTVQDVELIEYGRRIANELNIVGPANIQCFKQEGEPPKFFEVNPRFSGSLPLTIESGVNTPLYALDWAAGQESQFDQDFKETTMCRYWNEVFIADGHSSAPIYR